MPCSKYKGAQRRLCYATDEWKRPPRFSNVRRHLRTNSSGRVSVVSHHSRKNMNWKQARKVFPWLRPKGDIDKDGVKNKDDCRPFDKKRQDDDQQVRDIDILMRRAMKSFAGKMKDYECLKCGQVASFPYHPRKKKVNCLICNEYWNWVEKR